MHEVFLGTLNLVPNASYLEYISVIQEKF